MDGQRYLAEVSRQFESIKGKVEASLAQIDDDALVRGLTPEQSSVAIIVKHMAGNLRSRWRDFLTADGEKADRDRDSEFVLTVGDTRATLLERWNEGFGHLFVALSQIGPDDLERTVYIRREAHTVMQAIQRQLAHYSYHSGQIVQLAKHHAGVDWKPLSIAPGQSSQFNANPEPYTK